MAQAFKTFLKMRREINLGGAEKGMQAESSMES